MPEFLALKNTGDTVTMVIDKMHRQKSNFGEDYVFTGKATHPVTGVASVLAVAVPERACEQQMKRLGVPTGPDFVDRFVTISRGKLLPNKHPTWDIEFASQGSMETPAPRARVQVPGTPEDLERDRLQAERRAAAESAPTAAAEPAVQAITDKMDDKARAAAERRNADLKAIRTRFHALWESEAKMQIAIATRVNTEALEAEVVGYVPLVPSCESINAAVATQFIEYNKRGLL